VPGAADALEHFAKFVGAGWFAEDAVDLFGHVAVFFHEGAPAGEHDDGCAGRFEFDGFDDLAAIEVRHSQIGEDHVKGLFPVGRGAEFIDAALAAVGEADVVTVALEDFAQQFAQERFVIDAKNFDKKRKLI